MAILTRAEWVEKWFPVAKNVTAGTGIFPQIMMATAIIESQGKVGGVYYPGQSAGARLYNNYFGIKADKSWTGERIYLWTTETVQGQTFPVQRWFRVYDSIKDSFRDYVRFLKSNERYEEHKVFDAATIEEQAKRLKAAGYASGDNYATLLVKVATSLKASGIAENTGLALAVLAIIFLTFRNA